MYNKHTLIHHDLKYVCWNATLAQSSNILFLFCLFFLLTALSSEANFISQWMWTFWIVRFPGVSFSTRTTCMSHRFPTGSSSTYYYHHTTHTIACDLYDAPNQTWTPIVLKTHFLYTARYITKSIHKKKENESPIHILLTYR